MTSFDRAYRVSAVAACTLIAGALTTAVLADQILVNDSSTLTSYLVTSTSNEQDVRPLVLQRGVHIDGTLRAPPLLPMALAGNPFGESWNSNNTISGIRVDTGTLPIADVDLALPAPGFSWVVGRTYNCRQKDSGGSYMSSNGFQGYNWFQTSAPEIKLFEGASDDLDIMYLIYGADRFVEFKRKDNSSSSNFAGVNGAAGAFAFTAGASTEPDTYTYTDQRGYQFVFFGFDTDSGVAKGQLWKITDPAGNAAYVGDATTGSTAISGGFNGSGWATTVYQGLAAGATRRFTYDYTSGRLDSVTVAEKPSGGSYTNTGAKVEYTYYGSESYGESGDLKLVTITTPLTDSGVTHVRSKYFRYYEGTYDATTNPGYHHQLQYVYDYEGVRQYNWLDSDLTDTLTDLDAASENALKAHATAYFKYDTERRIKAAWFNGACGCSGGISGEHTISYDTNTQYSDSSGYDSSATEWLSRAYVILPSFESSSDPYDPNDLELRVWQYVDEVGQPLHRVMSASSSPDETNARVFQVVRNSDGQLTSIGSPANIEDYVHTIGASWIVDSKENADSGSSLVNEFTRISSGNTKGFIEYSKHKQGIDGTAYYDSLLAYTTRDLKVGDVNLSRPLVTSSTAYPQEISSGSTGALTTSISYTFQDNTAPPSNTSVLYICPRIITTTPPAVTTGKNGSGASVVTNVAMRTDGTTALVRTLETFVYTGFTNGLLTTRVEDSGLTASYPTGESPPDFFEYWTETEDDPALNWTTTYTYDAQGRLDTTNPPGGRVLKNYYSKLKDGRLVTLNYNDFDSGTPKFYGPVQYTVSNLAGRSEVQATVALASNESTTALTGHIDETDADPVTAMDLGTVARMSASLYDETGQLLESSRTYFSIPSAYSSSADGTHYDATMYGYDDAGHLRRTEDATGTIERSFFTLFGQLDKRFIGTDDSDWVGGDTGGTNNMVDLTTDAYSDNFLLTQRVTNGMSGGSGYTVGSSGDDGTVDNTLDYRGRTVVKSNAHAPHELYKYDNMNRVLTVGYYSSTSGLSASSDPTSVTTNRVGRMDYEYDELGRVWKSTRHKINSSGSSTDSIDTLQWFDAWGRAIKTDGSELSKTRYDRLGRVTHQFMLAQDNDSTYAHVWTLDGAGLTYETNVAGDIVLEEHRTVYDPADGNVIMSAAISRLHTDYGGGETTGALDTNADSDNLLFTAANLKGRIQITANWYDRFDRLTDTVQYGTYGGSNFDRDGLGVPSRSDTELLTEYEFNTDGTLLEVADPKNLKTRYEYDALGRQTLVINNYVNGAPSGLTADDDALTRYVYSDGLMTKLWVDIYPKDTDGTADSEDEVTEYTYGVTKYVSDPPDLSTYSLIASGPGDYADRDRFNRITTSRWTKDLTTDRDLFNLTIAYDRNSNITRTEDNVFTAGKDIAYTMDNLNRLTDAQWGTWGGSSIGSEVRQRTWTLDQVGNWRYDKLDLEDDNDYNGTGERNEDRTHNLPNELLGRDTDDNGTDDFTLVYNKRGDLTDDNETYKYEYDAFGRLKKIKDQRGTPNLVAEYRYNGLGHRIAWHYDVDASGVPVDGSDPWFHFVYDDQWRIVATYRGSDSSPKEQFVYHHAGRAGPGGGQSSSYIDAVVLRDRDMTNGWEGAADGTLEERTYYCQNWRADVVALVTSGGAQIQQTRYGEYGEAFGLPKGDTDGDGDVNSGDTVDSDQIQTWINGSAYDVRGDLDLDGDVDSTDKTAAIAMAGTVLGWGNMSLGMSAAGGGNRKGYAGYENDGVLEASLCYHVRHRVYHVNLARWNRRDPLEYEAGLNLHGYVGENPLRVVDPYGLSDDHGGHGGPFVSPSKERGLRSVLLGAAEAPGMCEVENALLRVPFFIWLPERPAPHNPEEHYYDLDLRPQLSPIHDNRPFWKVLLGIDNPITFQGHAGTLPDWAIPGGKLIKGVSAVAQPAKCATTIVNLAPDIVKKIKHFRGLTHSEKKIYFDTAKRTYERHLKKYKQTPGNTTGETNRMERELDEMRRILKEQFPDFDG